MKRLQLRELQEITLELLKEFDSICEQHNIKYVLGGGSLLGAVRHQGFIPWDDDADVMMLRSEYEKLLTICHTMKLGTQRKFISLKDKSFARNYARYARTDYHKNEEGFEESDCPWVGIDIFPIDYVTENDKLYKKQVKKLAFLRKLLLSSVTVTGSGTSFIKKIGKNILRPITKMIGSFRLAEAMERECMRYNDGDKIYVAALCGMYGLRERWKKEDFDPIIRIPFEGYMFPVPKNYDIYLTNLYHDYMEIPSKDKVINSENYEKVRVNVSSALNLRATPKGAIINKLDANEIVYRLEKATEKVANTYWDKVMKENGIIGYVARETYDYEPQYKLYLIPVVEEQPENPDEGSTDEPTQGPEVPSGGNIELPTVKNERIKVEQETNQLIIIPETTVQQIRDLVGADIKVIDKEGKELDITAIPGTGSTINGNYTIIMIGDANGDGRINSGDLFNIQKSLIQNSTLEEYIRKSMDANKDGKINSGDLFIIQKHLLGKGNITID